MYLVLAEFLDYEVAVEDVGVEVEGDVGHAEFVPAFVDLAELQQELVEVGLAPGDELGEVDVAFALEVLGSAHARELHVALLELLVREDELVDAAFVVQIQDLHQQFVFVDHHVLDERRQPFHQLQHAPAHLIVVDAVFDDFDDLHEFFRNIFHLYILS